jgi:hypothetical protein
MTALFADIDFGIAPFIVKAAVVMTMLGGFALLAFIAILAAVKRRSGIAVFAGGLLTLGLLLSAGLGLSWVSMRSDRAFDLSPHSIKSELPIHWTSWNPDELRQVPVWPRLGLLLLIGAAIVVFTGMLRRNPSSEERHTRRGWWPVLLVPALLVVAAPLFYLQFADHRSVSYATPGTPPRPPRPLAHFSRDEDAISQKKAAQLEAKLQQQIAEMDIHELMDLFDAPRIVITTPRKITFPILSNLPKPISLPVKSITILLAAAESSEDSDSLAGADKEAELELVVEHSDDRLIAEADAAVEAIVAESKTSESHSTDKHAVSEIKAEAEPAAAVGTNDVADGPHVITERSSTKNRSKQSGKPWSARPRDDAASLPWTQADMTPSPDRTIGTFAERPHWAVVPPGRVGDVRRFTLCTGPWSTEPECERERDRLLMTHIYSQIQWLNGTHASNQTYKERLATDADSEELNALQRAGITIDYAHREIAKEEYWQIEEHSFGPMKRLWTLIEYTPAVDRELRQRWDTYRRQERFAVVSAGAGGVLGLLGLCYGLLKVDTWTKGYYTKRLFLGVPAAIIGAGTLLAAMIFG